MTEVWELAHADIGLRCWDEGCIAYQPLTGETHMLNPQAGRLLGLLRDNQRSSKELTAALGGASPLPEFTESVNAWLLQLSEANLICLRQS